MPATLAEAKQCFERSISMWFPPAPAHRPPSRLCQIDCLFNRWREAGSFSITKQATFRESDPQKLLDHYEFQLRVYAWAIQAGSASPTRVAIITFRPKVTVTECE